MRDNIDKLQPILFVTSRGRKPTSSARWNLVPTIITRSKICGAYPDLPTRIIDAHVSRARLNGSRSFRINSADIGDGTLAFGE